MASIGALFEALLGGETLYLDIYPPTHRRSPPFAQLGFTQVAAAIGALKDGCTTSEQASCYVGAHCNPICHYGPRCIRHVVGVPNFNTVKEHGVSIPASPAKAARWQGDSPFVQLFPDVQCQGPVLRPRSGGGQPRGKAQQELAALLQ